MAAVFLAWDTHLEVERAVKLLHPSLILNEGIALDFEKKHSQWQKRHIPISFMYTTMAQKEQPYTL